MTAMTTASKHHGGERESGGGAVTGGVGSEGDYSSMGGGWDKPLIVFAGDKQHAAASGRNSVPLSASSSAVMGSSVLTPAIRSSAVSLI